uniref:PDZ domain-containing protein n=1 Tax=Caenorhabditis japonica TaxID=281687 RepID=A0A8R1E240_CAEJA
MIREMDFSIECAAGTPNYREFKVTEGMLFTNVPMHLTPPIEYCDHLLEINGVTINDRKHMRETFRNISHLKKEHILKIKVRRVFSVEKITQEKLIPSNATTRRKPDQNYFDKPLTSYSYWRVVLIYFPRSKLGFSVKSYDNQVYVEGTDNSWGSTTRRFLYLADAILKVDKTEITNNMQLHKALRTGLQQNGIVTLIIERCADPVSSSFVRQVLNFSKNAEPLLPSDTLQICKERLEYLKTHGFGPEQTPIFVGNVKIKNKTKVSATHTDKREYKSPIGTFFNPSNLYTVPDWKDPNVK